MIQCLINHRPLLGTTEPRMYLITLLAWQLKHPEFYPFHTKRRGKKKVKRGETNSVGEERSQGKS